MILSPFSTTAILERLLSSGHIENFSGVTDIFNAYPVNIWFPTSTFSGKYQNFTFPLSYTTLIPTLLSKMRVYQFLKNRCSTQVLIYILKNTITSNYIPIHTEIMYYRLFLWNWSNCTQNSVNYFKSIVFQKCEMWYTNEKNKKKAAKDKTGK